MLKSEKARAVRKRKMLFNKAAFALALLFCLFNISLYADPIFDPLVGVYRGTYTNNDGISSVELLVFKNGNSYQAAVYFTTSAGSPPSQVSGSYLANVLYNASISQFEIIGASGINMPFGMEYVDFRGALRGSSFSGSAGAHRNYNSGWTFSTNAIATSNYRYTGAHEHVAASASRVITQPTCSRTGVRAFNCVFCNAEAKRENIQTLSHTPSGNWILTKETSCKEEGERIRRCRDCNEVARTEAIPKLEHKPDGVWVVEKQSLCNETGLKVQYCTVCKEIGLSEDIPPLTDSEHDFKEHAIKGSILIPPIVREKTCKVCGYIEGTRNDFAFIWFPILLIICIVGGTIFVVNYWLKKIKFTCPFCINDYNINKVLYECPDCGEKTTQGLFKKSRVKCGNAKCGNWATMRRCPVCGEEIPKTALETPNLPFSIIGVSGSGKTNYITVLLNELGRFPGLRLSLFAQNSYTSNHQDENYKLIYEHHTPPESTAQTAVGTNLTPQIWRIKNSSKKRWGSVPTYTFTIFDGAGEDHEHNLNKADTVCRYIKTSKAIMLLLDPLVLQNIRKGGIVDEEVMSNSLAGKTGETKKAGNVVGNVVSYIKSAYNIGENKLLSIPVAVVLSKFDTIRNHSAFKNTLVTKESRLFSGGKFNMDEVKQVDEEIRVWLKEIGEGTFIDDLESNFKTFYFFGVSSYGDPPTSATTLPEITPKRVLDPILWLFKMAKFID